MLSPNTNVKKFLKIPRKRFGMNLPEKGLLLLREFVIN